MCVGPDVLFRDKWSFLDICIMCGTPNRQWGTPHFSQPATEEWMHLTALWGTWNTLNIENHLQGHWCGLFDHIIQSRCLSYRGDSQPASEERPLLQTGHWGTAAVWGDRAHGTLKTMSSGPDVLLREKESLFWYMHHVWYSRPATEKHPITPNRPLRKGCILQYCGARETN